MTRNRNHLTQPISAECDSNGQLLRADEALLQLQYRAGGALGQVFAIPALAHVIALSLQLQMRLSRIVRVADIENDIEMLVETKPSAAGVEISIKSWRDLPMSPESHKEEFLSSDDKSNADLFIQTDAQGRMILAHGNLAKQISFEKFGNPIWDFIQPKDVADDGFKNILSLQASQQFSIIIDNLAGAYQAIVSRRTDTNGQMLGLDIKIAQQEFDADYIQKPSQNIFSMGAQMGPTFRQPIDRIIANAETIRAKMQGPIRDSYAIYAKDIADAGRYLLELIEDLSDMEAIERPDFTTAADHIELGDVIRRVAGLLALKASEKDIMIQVPPPEMILHVRAEFRRVLQILLNLVGNAIRYSPSASTILISVEQNGDTAKISVCDQGAGIAADDLSKIFEKFERLGRTGDGGSGLGLYISRRLARAMGGDIIVTSFPNHGTIFALMLPLETEHKAKPA